MTQPDKLTLEEVESLLRNTEDGDISWTDAMVAKLCRNLADTMRENERLRSETQHIFRAAGHLMGRDSKDWTDDHYKQLAEIQSFLEALSYKHSGHGPALGLPPISGLRLPPLNDMPIQHTNNPSPLYGDTVLGNKRIKESGTILCGTCNNPMPQTAVPAAEAWCSDLCYQNRKGK